MLLITLASYYVNKFQLIHLTFHETKYKANFIPSDGKYVDFMPSLNHKHI